MIVLLNKPYGVLCQFTDRENRPTLADYVTQPGIYAAGRLDADSEGLLLLTDDGGLIHRLGDPRHRVAKTYWVQVEGEPNAGQLQRLCDGVQLSDGPTAAAEVDILGTPTSIWPRQPPIRVRKTVPDSWIQISITEGRNRQVRRMTAAVGLPTLRLIRVRIGSHELGELVPGQSRIVDRA